MKLFAKVVVVIGAYIAAFVGAFAAVALIPASPASPEAQAASGMYAFSDALLFVTAFVAAGIVLIGAALFFLRPSRSFWTVLAALTIAAAAAGSVTAILVARG